MKETIIAVVGGLIFLLMMCCSLSYAEHKKWECKTSMAEHKYSAPEIYVICEAK